MNPDHQDVGGQEMNEFGHPPQTKMYHDLTLEVCWQGTLQQ